MSFEVGNDAWKLREAAAVVMGVSRSLGQGSCDALPDLLYVELRQILFRRATGAIVESWMLFGVNF